MFVLLAASLISTRFQTTAQTPTAAAVWDKVKSKLHLARTLSGSYVKDVVGPDGKRAVVSCSFAICRPDRFLITEGDGSRIRDVVASDGISTVQYMKLLNMYLQQPSDPDREHFASFLGPALSPFLLSDHRPYQATDEPVQRAVLNGISVYAFHISRKNANPTGDDTVVYVDANTYQPVACHRLSHGADESAFQWNYRDIRIDALISDQELAYHLPAGATPYREPDLLPIGSVAPGFSATNEAGDTLALKDLVRNSRALLLFFWSYG